MSTERWRCFVAVPLGEELRRELALAADGWRLRPELVGLRWTDPASWHVTLAFLGPIDPPAAADLGPRLDVVAAGQAPILLPSAGVGAFPTAARARVAWYGVADPDGALAALAGHVRQATRLDGGVFRAHVTLARARHESVDLRPWVRDAGAPSGELTVDRIELMRSHLRRGPARYEVLHSSAVGVASHV